MNNIFDQVDTYSKRYNLLPTGSKVVLGFSGGPDSVFLLHYLNQLKQAGQIELIAAHLDHEWRNESAQDAQFCQEAARALGVRFVGRKISELGISLKFKGSQEELGRRARRSFLQQVKIEFNADCIALAHHADDQEETFFIRLIRGSSLSGLTGMRPQHGDYIRPLLGLKKEHIISFLEQQNIAYLTDPSNKQLFFLRNRIRAQVLPALREADSRFDKNFFATLTRLQETDEFLEKLAATTLAALSTQKDPVIKVDREKLLALEPVLQYRMLLAWLCQSGVPFTPTQAFLDEIRRFLSQPESKMHTIHQFWAIAKKKKLAWIESSAE